MAKKIKSSQLDTLLNPLGKKRRLHEHKQVAKSAEISVEEVLTETAEERPGLVGGSAACSTMRPGWKSETDTDTAQNPKKVKVFAKLFKPRQKLPEVTPVQSGSVDILDIIAPTSADLYHRDYIVVP